MKYLLFYTKGCVPHIKQFPTYGAAQRFARIYRKKHTGNPDNWVDFIVKGRILKKYPEAEGITFL